MRSMTAYAEVFRPLARGQLRLALRSVNHRGLEVSVRLHPALLPLEQAIRAAIRASAQRGKLDLQIEVQDEPDLEPRLNAALLRGVAKAWKAEAEWLDLPPLTAEAFFRLPGAWMPVEGGLAERLESEVLAGLQELLDRWNEAREAEGNRLEPFFSESAAGFAALKATLQAEAEAQAAELPGLLKARLDQVLQDAGLQGQLPAERVAAEAGLWAERQDVREELVRIQAHLDDFRARLRRGQLGGKALDVWCQEMLREFNTCGSKCKRLAMTRAVMEAKGLLEQVREQGANLE